MAVPSGVLSRHGTGSGTTLGIGNIAREDLTDIIYNISPTERPFHQNVSRENATNDLHEWVIDSLAAAVDDNAHVDGDDFNAEGQTSQAGSGSDGVMITPGSRRGNYQQIGRKDIVVSRRADIVRKAGRRSELNYQVAKAGRELQRDCEMSATANQAAVAGTNTTAPRTAGIPAWLTTNDLGATGAVGPTLSNGVPNAARTGTASGTRNMAESLLLQNIASIYNAGGDPDMIMMHPSAKQRFSNYMFSANARIATQYQDAGAKPSKGLTVVGAVDVYVSDFGVLDVVPNRFQREADIFVLDTEMWGISYLDGYHVEKIGKTGDSDKRVLIVDWGVVCKNEAASGGIFERTTAAWTASIT